MYFFGTLNRREKRLIIILTTANLLVMGLLFAGTRSYAARSGPSETEATRITSDSGNVHSPVAILNTPEN